MTLLGGLVSCPLRANADGTPGILWSGLLAPVFHQAKACLPLTQFISNQIFLPLPINSHVEYKSLRPFHYLSLNLGLPELSKQKAKFRLLYPNPCLLSALGKAPFLFSHSRRPLKKGPLLRRKPQNYGLQSGLKHLYNLKSRLHISLTSRKAKAGRRKWGPLAVIIPHLGNLDVSGYEYFCIFLDS